MLCAISRILSGNAQDFGLRLALQELLGNLALMPQMLEALNLNHQILDLAIIFLWF